MGENSTNPLENLFSEKNTQRNPERDNTQTTPEKDIVAPNNTITTKVESVIVGDTQEIQTNNVIILTGKNGEVAIPVKASGLEFLKENKNSVDFSLIEQLFNGYDGSIESINQIFETLKNMALERLKQFDGNIDNIFGEEFRKTLSDLKQKFDETERSKENFLKINTGNRFQKFIIKAIFTLTGNTINDILEKIRNTKDFVLEVNGQIEAKTKEAQGLEEKNKEEFKFLLTQYVIQLILKYLIEKKLNESHSQNLIENSNVEAQDGTIKGIPINYEKELLKARLNGINAQLATIVSTLKMSNGVSKEIGTTIINVNVSYENLIQTLNNLIQTVISINTLTNINEISQLLQNLKKISLEETSEAYADLLNQKIEILERAIEYQKSIQKTIRESIKNEEKTEKEIEQKQKELQEQYRISQKLEKEAFAKLLQEQKAQQELLAQKPVKK